MTNLEIAQTIASKIETHTQEEVDAMMAIVCELNNIDQSWLLRAVSNLYMKSSNYSSASNKVDSYSESDPR